MPCPHCPGLLPWFFLALLPTFKFISPRKTFFVYAAFSRPQQWPYLTHKLHHNTTSTIELPARWLEAMTLLMSCLFPQRWSHHHVNNSRCHAWSAFIVVTSPVRYLDLCDLLRRSTRKIQADLSMEMNSDSCFASSMFISISAITTGVAAHHSLGDRGSISQPFLSADCPPFMRWQQRTFAKFHSARRWPILAPIPCAKHLTKIFIVKNLLKQAFKQEKTWILEACQQRS